MSHPRDAFLRTYNAVAGEMHASITNELRQERDTARRELAETRAILSDLLEQRGESWLAQLVGRREELFADLTVSVCDGCDPDTSVVFHRPGCTLGDFLRITGGPEETQRQVDAAHEAALFDVRLKAASARVPVVDGLQNMNDVMKHLYPDPWSRLDKQEDK